jgi:glycosyltransferase involved in cell wall biosynthesis
MSDRLRVLHLDFGQVWGGGQGQVATLIKESAHLPIDHYLIAPGDSRLPRLTKDYIKGFLPVDRNILAHPLGVLRARAFCRLHQIQILHAHCGKSHTFAFWLKRLLMPEVRLVVHRRIPARIRAARLSRAKFIRPEVNHFLTVSDFIRSVLIQGGVAADRVTTVRSTKPLVDCSGEVKQQAREGVSRISSLAPGGSFFILSASRLVPDKGLFILLEGFRRLIPTHPGARLLIAGQGPLEAELKHVAKDLTDSGHVLFLGFRADIPNLLLGADVFAIPSLSEGLGSVIVEAMMANTAVVGASVEGIPELVRDGETGLSVPPSDAEALGRALERLAADPALRHRLAAQALSWARRECTPQIMVEQTFSVYLKTLG